MQRNESGCIEATIAAHTGEDQGVSEHGPERLKARIWVYGRRYQSVLRQGPGPTRPPQSCLSISLNDTVMQFIPRIHIIRDEWKR